jgi:hypothetical protein
MQHSTQHTLTATVTTHKQICSVVKSKYIQGKKETTCTHIHKHLTNFTKYATVYADDEESSTEAKDITTHSLPHTHRQCDEEEGGATQLNSHKKLDSPANNIIFITLSKRAFF